jgi:hypothetical protein
MEIKRTGSQPSGKGPAEYFTGTVRIDPLFEAPEPARVRGASVTFEPGARTAWHTHPLGQTLIVMSGLGWAQRWGGPVEAIVTASACGRRHAQAAPTSRFAGDTRVHWRVPFPLNLLQIPGGKQAERSRRRAVGAYLCAAACANKSERDICVGNPARRYRRVCAGREALARCYTDDRNDSYRSDVPSETKTRSD